MREEKLDREALALLYVLYFIVLIWIIVFKCNVNEILSVESNGANFLVRVIPYMTMIEIFQSEALFPKFIFFINILAFVPMGLTFPFFMKRKKALVRIFIISFLVEIFQLFIGWGGYDSTDVITCFWGGAFGVWVYQMLRPKICNRQINNIVLVLISIAGFIAIFAVISTVTHFPSILLDKWKFW